MPPRSSLFNLQPQVTSATPTTETPSAPIRRSSLFTLSPTPTPVAVTPTTPQRRFLEGGPIEKAFDILRTGEFAVGGLLSGKGVLEGIRTRTESQPEFERLFREAGMPDHWATRGAAFVASFVVDPINLVGTGIVSKALKAGGAFKAAATVERVGAAPGRVLGQAVQRGVETLATKPGRFGEIARGVQAGKELEPILEVARIRESRGVENVVTTAKDLRADALRITGNQRDAMRLDQTVGAYFDIGADTMVSEIARAQGAADRVGLEVIQRARQVGQQAQQRFLQTLPEEARRFVEEWAPRLAADDAKFAEDLVRVGMMKPETAAKWEGFHLRRIYQKFEDPQEFVEFLARTDPAKAVELTGKIERGIPIQRVGQPIPTAVTRSRKALEEETRKALGEIPQASSRFIAGGVLAEQAIARGEAFANIAAKFAVDKNVVESAGELAPRFFTQIPDTAGWGKLAGVYLPREIATPLLQARQRPEGINKVLEAATGWFKFSKVILNPATHMRNVRTNISLIHNQVGLGGLDPRIWVKAIREVVTNGRAFQEAKAVSSAFVDTFTKTELRTLVKNPTEQGLVDYLRRAGAGAARLYEIEEQVGKMVVYLTMRGRQFSPEASAKAAELALFNYRKVPGWVDRARRIGIYPFLTFPYKVATETLPQVVRRPGRFSQQAKIIEAFREPLTEEEQRALPPHMRNGGMLKFPFVLNGHPVLFDLTYELAYGDIAEAGTPITALAQAVRRVRAGEFDPGELLRDLIPFMTPLGQVAAELALNRSAFTGREIFPEGETPRQKVKLIGQHAARFAAPSILSKTILPGGELRRSIEAALPGGSTGVSPSGREPLPLPQAALSTLAGLKTQMLDVKRERRFRALDLRRAVEDINARIRSVARDQSLDDATRRARITELVRQRDTVVKRFRETGSARP